MPVRTPSRYVYVGGVRGTMRIHHAFLFLPTTHPTLELSIKHISPNTLTKFEEQKAKRPSTTATQKPHRNFPNLPASLPHPTRLKARPTTTRLLALLLSFRPHLSKTMPTTHRTLAWRQRKLTSFPSPSITGEPAGRTETNDPALLHCRLHPSCSSSSSTTSSSSSSSSTTTTTARPA